MNEEQLAAMLALFQLSGMNDPELFMQIVQAMYQKDPDSLSLLLSLADQAMKSNDLQLVQAIAQAVQQTFAQVVSAKNGAKLDYINKLNGNCPEGYEKFGKGGKCRKCQKGSLIEEFKRNYRR